jgi:thioredoxin-like negative regulator of GroEL
MRPSVRRLEEAYQDRVDFHILNIDHHTTAELAIKYQVAGIPMIVLLDSNGDPFRVMVGPQTEEDLFAAVEALLAAEQS